MKKRFDVDEQNKIVKLGLYYDKADDVLESNINTKVPTFNRDKFGRIKEIISDFPQEYKADGNVKIDDYQDYKPQDVLDFVSVFADLPRSIQAINDATGTPEQSILVTMTVIFSVIQLLAAVFETLGGFAALSAFFGKGRF